MPVYQVTFKSGTQQFFDMGEDDAILISDKMASDYGRGVVKVSTGATIDTAEVVGFQHYITPEYAVKRANEDSS